MKKVLVLDFGGQYNLLVARRVREYGVYCEIKSYRLSMEDIRAFAPDALILTGGPATVFEPNAPMVDKALFEMGIPVLGICYGQQLMMHLLGGQCRKAETREYGKIELTHIASPLFENVPETSVCWMSHGVEVERMAPGFRVIATTEGCGFAAVENAEKKLYGVQFHPEVLHTVYGTQVLENFLYRICGFSAEWTMASYLDEAVAECRRQIGSGRVLLALSGGVDSSVAAALLQRAVGDQLTCIFVDHGLLRKDEGDQVEQVMKHQFHVDVRRVNAGDRFLSKLAGVTEPEHKRKIIGEEFIHVFEEEAAKLQGIRFLGQGTIYPDIVESDKGVKAHHNVGGLPEKLGFELVEPVKYLFKDEVRAVGEALGLPHSMVWRQPFPGPGLGVRCIGAITRDRLAAVRESDAILREEFAKSGMDAKVWQYFTIVPDIRTTGVVDGKRTELWPVIIRAVNTTDAMTASVPRLDWELLETVTRRVQAEVPGVSRVLYDLSPKPPATIEWE